MISHEEKLEEIIIDIYFLLQDLPVHVLMSSPLFYTGWTWYHLAAWFSYRMELLCHYSFLDYLFTPQRFSYCSGISLWIFESGSFNALSAVKGISYIQHYCFHLKKRRGKSYIRIEMGCYFHPWLELAFMIFRCFFLFLMVSCTWSTGDYHSLLSFRNKKKLTWMTCYFLLELLTFVLEQFYRVQIGLQSPDGFTTTREILRRFSDFLKLSSKVS